MPPWATISARTISRPMTGMDQPKSARNLCDVRLGLKNGAMADIAASQLHANLGSRRIGRLLP